MIFIYLLGLVTLLIASSAAYFSVYGLSHLFAGAAIPVIIMGASIEAGKLMSASFLYRYWNKIGIFLKSFLLLSTFIVMIVTSVGIFGFLTSAYQKDTLPLKELAQNIELLEETKSELTARKLQIDTQVENVSANRVRSKERLSNSFKEERDSIELKLNEVNEQLTKLKTEQINVTAKVGPVMLIAEVFNQDPNKAVFWFILILIIVFDPLAVALTIALNIAIKLKNEEENTIEGNINKVSLKKYIEKIIQDNK